MNGLPQSRLPILTVVLAAILVGCTEGDAGARGEPDASSDTAAARYPADEANTVAAVVADPDPCAGRDLPAIVGGAVGDLRVGMPIADVRRGYPVVDTTVHAEGTFAPILLVDVGGDSVWVSDMRGNVSRIMVTSPCFATRDSIRVGSPVSDFADFPAVRASFHGVTVPSWCGLFFPASGIRPRSTYYGPDEIAGMHGARVTHIMVLGGCP